MELLNLIIFYGTFWSFCEGGSFSQHSSGPSVTPHKKIHLSEIFGGGGSVKNQNQVNYGHGGGDKSSGIVGGGGSIKNQTQMNYDGSDGGGKNKRNANTLTTASCPSGHFECASDSSLCIPQNSICNSKPECPDGSDELNCEDTHAKTFWDNFFQKRPGADVSKNDSCTYDLRDGSTSHNKTENSSSLGGCHCSREKLFCQNLHLSNLNIIPSEVLFLDLSGSQVANMNFTAVGTRFQQLHTLILSSTSLRSIGEQEFSQLKSLEILHLTGNQLQTLPSNAFVSSPKLKKLFLGYNKLSALHPDALNGLNMLEELDLRNNKLKQTDGLFKDLISLKILHLSYNELESLEEESLTGLEKLEMLSLTKNQITGIHSRAFHNLTNLNHLYMSHNQLDILRDHTFCNLRALLNLNLNDNGIREIEPDAFQCLDSLQSLLLERNKFGELEDPLTIFANLTELQHIYFDQFWMCWWSPHVRNCEPKGDGISSVENLLDNIVLRTCVWIMGLVGVVGNSFVIVSRMVLREKNRVHSFYIKNLAVADLLMGLFLLSIAFHDVSFRGEFLARQHQWRHSLTCQWSGLLSTLSSEGSVLVLTLITLDRYVSITYPFIERRNALLPATLVVGFLWIFSFLLSFLPLSGWFYGYFGPNFYTSNGLCLPLHIHNPFDQGWEYSFVLFVLINSLAFTFISYAYWRMLRIIQTSTTSIRSNQQKQDGVLAKRFGLVVLTDFLCWAPVIISKSLAMAGVPIQSDFYAWLAVFVLPVNSALNPIIYTLTTKLFKQQVAHFTIGFRKRLGMATDESTTSSMYYRNRISRTLNTSMNSSMMMSTKERVRDRVDLPCRSRIAISSINSVIATSTGVNQLQNSDANANPVDAIASSPQSPKYCETET